MSQSTVTGGAGGGSTDGPQPPMGKQQQCIALSSDVHDYHTKTNIIANAN